MMIRMQNSFAAIDTYSESGAGYFRGSGNDITPQICSELKEFSTNVDIL